MQKKEIKLLNLKKQQQKLQPNCFTTQEDPRAFGKSNLKVLQVDSQQSQMQSEFMSDGGKKQS